VAYPRPYLVPLTTSVWYACNYSALLTGLALKFLTNGRAATQPPLPPPRKKRKREKRQPLQKKPMKKEACLMTNSHDDSLGLGALRSEQTRQIGDGAQRSNSANFRSPGLQGVNNGGSVCVTAHSFAKLIGDPSLFRLSPFVTSQVHLHLLSRKEDLDPRRAPPDP